MENQLLFFPFLSTLMIVLNVYNGDIFGISSNLEYIIWYIPPIIISVIKKGLKKTIINLHILFLGICVNIFWYFESPFKPGKKIRHRTEYYDTQALLCCLIYHSIYELVIRPKNQIL